MIDHALIEVANPCDTNMFPGGPKTVQEDKRLGSQTCPSWDQCKRGLKAGEWNCTMMMGHIAARVVVQENKTLDQAMGEWRASDKANVPKYITSDDRQEFRFIPTSEAEPRIRAFAEQLLGEGQQVDLAQRLGVDRAEAVGPGFSDVSRAQIKDGVRDPMRTRHLEGRYGTNGGRGCDVLRGPCSCGAFH